jgi:hypothetical protein
VRAFAVVVLQDLMHEHEKVEQPSLRQGEPDWRCSVSFAEGLIAHVRMDHVTVRFGSRCSFRNDLVGMRPADAIPMEDDPIRAQIDALQDDRLGQNADLLFFEIDSDLLELAFEGHHVGGHFVGRGDARWPNGRGQLRLQMLQLTPEKLEGVIQVFQHVLSGCIPAPAKSKLQMPGYL